MSRLYVDRISPYQSGSVQVDGLSIDTGSLTTLAEFNTYTSSNDGKVNSLIAATGSYAGLTSNTFVGDQVVTGSITINQQTGGANALFVQGDNVKYTVNSSTFKFEINNANRRFYTGGDTWGNLATDNSTGITMGQQYGFNVFNSAFTIDAGFAYNLNSAAGTGTNKVGIFGAGSGGYYDFISFEDATNWTDGRIEIHRTLQVDQVLQLQQQDPLPTGSVGQLAVSGSDLYFHNGSSWVLK